MKIDPAQMKEFFDKVLPEAPGELKNHIVTLVDCAIRDDYDGVTAAVDKLPPHLLGGLSFMLDKMSRNMAALSFYIERKLPTLAAVALPVGSPVPQAIIVEGQPAKRTRKRKTPSTH